LISAAGASEIQKLGGDLKKNTKNEKIIRGKQKIKKI